MKFDELDEKMRVYETAFDLCAVPGMYLVARIDGRSFTRLTREKLRETHQFDAPFDERFGDMMVGTTEHLMQCGFRVIYGYTQSDEISLLFHLKRTRSDASCASTIRFRRARRARNSRCCWARTPPQV